MAGCRLGARVTKLQSTKLLQSVRRGDVSGLETILSRGVPQLVNLLHPTYANSALIVAACEGNVVILDVLLSRGGADPDLRDAEGRTAVMHAARHGHVDCVTKLIEFGASVNIEDDHACGMLLLLLLPIIVRVIQSTRSILHTITQWRRVTACEASYNVCVAAQYLPPTTSL